MTQDVSAASSGKGMRIALYVISGLLSALYLFASSGKLSSNSQAIAAFTKYGYSDGFRMFIGSAELSGALGLWIPKLEFWAACGLMLIMLGAIYTHVSHGENPAGAVIALALLGFVARSRKSRALFLS